MTDVATLAGQVSEACAHKRPLCLQGGGSKAALLGRDCEGDALSTRELTGVVNYEPGELVISVRAGTTVRELEEVLAAENQYLPSATPHFDGTATLGGSLACNLSGHTRPWGGSLRDLVLGTELINGKGETLRFGGRVMKNVAGYDVSRLQAGALGTLGLITEVTLKVLPLPETEVTLVHECEAPRALEIMLQRGAEPSPLAGACWFDGRLFLRLAGAEPAVKRAAVDWGGETTADEAPWRALSDMSLAFFQCDEALIRLSLPVTSSLALSESRLLIDWGGAQRWVYAADTMPEWFENAARENGHAWSFRGGDRKAETAPPLSPQLQRMHRQIKQAMDPAGILNPGRLYSWL